MKRKYWSRKVHLNYFYMEILQRTGQSCCRMKYRVRTGVKNKSVCCYGEEKTKSYVVVSDDKKHDTAFALKAMDMIVNDIKQKDEIKESLEILTVSDGASSHFKNRLMISEIQ